MLAARDQENLVHAHQQVAAGKPLNQGIKQLQAKTPGNRAPKTPFKVALNDENIPTAFPGQKNALRNIGKGNENIIQTSKKDGQVDKNAFVTPMGARTRAPLGMKTTNVKARAFETPALTQAKPLQAVKKPSTASAKRKSKIVVAQPEPTLTDVLSQEDEDDLPDIEYMPPKPAELADPPEDIPYDDTFPQFKGKNFSRGWAQLYGPPVGPDGLTDTDREHERRLEELGKKAHDEFERQLNDDSLWPICEEIEEDRDSAKSKQSQSHGLKKDVDSVKARDAASALSTEPKQLSRLTKPTHASQQKAKSVLPSSILPRTKKSAPPPSNPSPMRHTALAAASRNTLGYSKGRNISSRLSDIAISNHDAADSGSVFDDLYKEEDDGDDDDEVFQLRWD